MHGGISQASAPDVASAMVTAGASLLLTATMLTAGTRLTADGLTCLRRRPGPLLIALLVNLLVVPGVATLGATVVHLEPGVTWGIVLAAAAPGGGSGVLLADHARGDPSIAVALQTLLALLGALAVPIWLLLAQIAAPLRLPDLAGRVALLLVLQLTALAAGAWLRARPSVPDQRIQRGSRHVADALLVTLTVSIVATSARELPTIPVTAYAVIVLVIGCSLAAHRLPGLGSTAVRRSIATVTAVRNLALAIAAAGTVAHARVVALTIVGYGVVTYLVVGCWLLSRRE